MAYNKVEMDRRSPEIIKQYVIEMKGEFPFGVTRPENSDTLIRLNKSYLPEQYQQLKKQLMDQSNMKHQNLVGILRIFESKKSKFFDIFYQYVKFDFHSRLKKLKKQQIETHQIKLLELCNYLLTHNYNPVISISRLGFTERSIIKYYLDLDSKIKNNKVDKKDLLKQKKMEIAALFDKLTKSIFSSNQISQSSNLILTSQEKNINKSRSQDSFLQHKISLNTRLQQQVTSNQKNTSLSNNIIQSNNNSSNNVFTKINLIDSKIKELEIGNGKKVTPSTNNNVKNLGSSFLNLNKHQKQSINNNKGEVKYISSSKELSFGDELIREQIPKQLTQKINNKDIYQRQDQKPNNRLFQNPNQSKNRAYDNSKKNKIQIPTKQYNTYVAHKRAFDQESIDTYRQELGEVIVMPKIMTNQQMRQTTNSPPKSLFEEKRNNKLHESVGMKQRNMILENINLDNRSQYLKVTKVKQDFHSFQEPSPQFKKPEPQINSNFSKKQIVKKNSNEKIENVKTATHYNSNPNLKQPNKQNSPKNPVKKQDRKSNRPSNKIQDKEFSFVQNQNEKTNQKQKQNQKLEQQNKYNQYVTNYFSNQSDGLYIKDILKVDKNEALVSDFNNLFDIGANAAGNNNNNGHKKSGKKNNQQNQHLNAQKPSESQSGGESRKNSENNIKEANSPESKNVSKRTKQINERVKIALQKSEATLQFFEKAKKPSISNPNLKK